MMYVIMAKSSDDLLPNWFKVAVSHEKKFRDIDAKILRLSGFQVVVVETCNV